MVYSVFGRALTLHSLTERFHQVYSCHIVPRTYVWSCIMFGVAGTLSTMQVKELCRRQLLAKTSLASSTDKCQSLSQPPSVSSGSITPLGGIASPAFIAPSPSPSATVDHRSPSFTADEPTRRPLVDSLRTADPTSSLVTWHIPAAACDVTVNRSPRPASNSTDSSDGSASQQFAAVN